MRTIRTLLLGPVLLSLILSACAGDPWRSVNRKNTLADYRRYVQQYPESKNIAKAREHMAFLELEREPTLGAYATFVSTYPDTQLAESVRPTLEPKAFERARFSGTPAAYNDFMLRYPDGPFADRALGNRVFLESGGFSRGHQALRHFATSHPSSDYAAEARKSLAAFELKESKNFKRVALQIKVSPQTPEAERLVGAFVDRAQRQFKAAGYSLVLVPELQTERQSAKLPKARLLIEHKEAPSKSKLSNGNFTRPGLKATTRVTLFSEAGLEPVWQRVFGLRLDTQQHFAGTSMLFNPNARGYWESFFVPVASWHNRAALRKTVASKKRIVAVDSAGDRTVIMHGDGEFQLLELANAESAVPLANYSRPKDFTRWRGVKVVGKRVLIYGDDGIEVVGFVKGGPRKIGAQERSAVGSVAAVVPVGKELLLASSRGLLMTNLNGGNPRRLMRRALKGLGRVGETLVFTDGESVFVSTLELLGQQRVLEQVNLGFEFAPSRVVGFEDSAVILGKTGAVLIDLKNPKKPVIASKLPTKQFGKIEDVVAMGSRLFLVGERGLQLLDPANRNVVETIDIEPRERVARMGRFLVATGKPGLQVIDTAPLTLAVKSPDQSRGVAAPDF